MKRTIAKIIIAALLCAFLALGITGCIIPDIGGSGNDDENGGGTTEHVHSFGEWTVTLSPTYTEEGTRTRTCTSCGETETASVAKLALDEYVAALVGTGESESVDLTLELAADAGADIFALIVKGMENARDGSVNLTIIGAEAIPSEAFKGCEKLLTVTVGKGVKSIGSEAFGNCHNIASATLGDDVETVGEFAFFACSALESIDLGNNVSTLERGALNLTGLKRVTIPDSVTNIGGSLLAYCQSLEEVVLSTGIESIPANIFFSTPSLKSVTIPNSVKSIENSAFRGAYIENLVIPDSVTSIGAEAFVEGGGIKSITFGKGITELSENLFFACTALEEIIFSSPISKVEKSSFYNSEVYVPSFNLATENVTLTFAQGQTVLIQNDDGSWESTDTLLLSATEFCGSVFKEIITSVEIDATDMTAENL